ncbi:heavy-metal-associated domain-containing protein [Robbsia sp. KACC 23696]|uniref:heavy-metal-associated domain-containing protein n=1 Tax=Robbsia sp. KACC 23696 TaxID=3149231 RepID=UPI00325BD6CB
MPQFQVSDMTCQHCVKAVTQAVREVDPDARVDIDLASGRVDVASSGSPETLRAAIDAAGYPAATV